MLVNYTVRLSSTSEKDLQVRQINTMNLFRKSSPPSSTSASSGDAKERLEGQPIASAPDTRKPSYSQFDNSPYPLATWRTVVMGILVSMGGLIFGFDTGQISGFLEMNDFLQRFGELLPDPKNPGGPPTYQFTNTRSGLIVGMLSIGTLIGALIAAPFANAFGRKYSISAWCIVFSVGVIVQIAADTKWYEIVIGRWVAGLGIGALSILVPLYQSESAPTHVRGAIVWYVLLTDPVSSRS